MAPTGAREARPKARLEGVTPEAMSWVGATSRASKEPDWAPDFPPDLTVDWTVDSESANKPRPTWAYRWFRCLTPPPLRVTGVKHQPEVGDMGRGDGIDGKKM